ncbi:MAG: SDR family oxidoreductase [bacterium]|nr:SDR family oxidoreductase [bacterium]
MLLDGKIALITGGGRGIGRGIALAFAEQGCHIAVASRSLEEVKTVADEARASGVKALALECDVADDASVERMVADTLTEFGHIDILVNNAGHACFKPFVEMTPAEWRRTMDVNLTAPAICIQAVLPSMMARKSGRIINISSVAALKPLAHQAAYCASKYGINGLTKVLALELRQHGINVHAVCPGAVNTQLAREAMPDRDHSQWMSPEDVAHACLYLASMSPRATTDEILVRRFGSAPIGGVPLDG